MTFSVGDKVIWEDGNPRSVAYKIVKVFKVHKSGNFVLDGSPQQFNQNGHATGDNWYRPMVWIWTQEKEDRLKSIKEDRICRNKFMLAAKNLGMIAHSNSSIITGADVEALKAILDRCGGKSGSKSGDKS